MSKTSSWCDETNSWIDLPDYVDNSYYTWIMNWYYSFWETRQLHNEQNELIKQGHICTSILEGKFLLYCGGDICTSKSAV